MALKREKHMNTEKLYADFRGELLGFIQKRVKNKEQSEDILQDVFVKIHTKKDQLEEDEKVVSWVYKITRNAIIDYYRARKTIEGEQQQLNLEDIAENGNVEFLDLGCMKKFVKELPEDYREAIELTTYGALSQKELAEKLGMSYSGAKSRVQRARQKLRDLVVDCCNPKVDKYGNVIHSNHGSCKC